MEAITLRELAQAVGGRILSKDAGPDTPVTGAVSDNRKVKPGDVFFAFVGENTNGHRYVNAALDAGASGCVISEDVTKGPEGMRPGRFYILVDDTIAAAGDLARWYRSRFAVPVVAVTGSVGKTTTKDMIAAVLAEKFRVRKTERNFNNSIGLPRTLLSLDSDTEIAVVEMGMNHAGEIDSLVSIARPTAAVITNIGDAHIGNLGSKENIFRAKCEIFHGLTADGFAVLNGDDEYLVRLKDEPAVAARFPILWAGAGEGCDYRAEDIRAGAEAVSFKAVMPEGTIDITVPVPGRHMIYPAMTAAAIGAHFGMTPEEIRAGIAHYVPTGMRMEIMNCPGGVTIYNDTYNANPQSMKAALETLAQVKGRRRIAVLGDMGELGDDEERLHREVGAFAAAEGTAPDVLVTVGRASAAMADEARRLGHPDVRVCADKAEAMAVLDGLMGPDTAFLCKASRFMALEELTAHLKERAGGA